MNRKILVTEEGFDNIGAILDGLGEGYKYQVIEWSDNPFDSLTQDDILFINCHSSCTTSPGDYKKQLRKFVSGGGILYASDWAGALIAEAFGDYLEFSDDGKAEAISVKVTDAGLKEILGTQITLNFDLEGWWRIIKSKKDVNKLLTYQDKPLLVSFKVDRGYVLYTSFHNKSQVSKLEKALLEYLVFKPLLSKVTDQAAQQAVNANYKIDKEIISSAKTSQALNLTYSVAVDKPATILGILSWEGSAQFEITLEDPQKGLIKKSVSDKSPCGIEYFAQQVGTWFIRVNPLKVPYPNFPFALTLAKGGEKQQIASNIFDTSSQGLSTSSSQGIPVSQMSPLQPSSFQSSSPIVGSVEITGGKPVQRTIAAPVLFPILNMGGLPRYDIRWMPLAGQDGYILQESESASFQDAKEAYRGNLTSFSCANRTVGRYYYRICSYVGNENGSWSEIQSVEVLHNP